MQVQAALFTRPVAASSDYDRAVSAFVSESNSPEGRSLKTRGMDRLKQLNPNLSADHVRVIASFVNESNGLEGRGLKLNGLARLLQIQPNLSPSAMRIVASGVNESETLEGRDHKLRGFAQLYRAQPDLPDDVLSEMSQLVCGSNGVEGYALKFDSLSRMLALQPRLSADFVRALRRLVDESNGVEGRRLKLRNVEEMLRRDPGLTPSMLRATESYVNESNSLEGRGLKLQSIVGLIGSGLTPEQLSAMASGVNACPGIDSRRVAVAGYESVLKANPGTAPEILTEMGRFLSGPSTDDGRAQFTRLAVQVVEGDPQVSASTFRHLRRSTAGAYTPADGIVRAEVAYNDLLIARGVGRPVEELATLQPPATAGGANVSLPLEILQNLRERPELKLADESIARANLQATHFENAMQGTANQIVQGNYERYTELWAARGEKIKTQIMLTGAAVGVTAAVGMLFVPGLSSFAALGMFGGMFLGGKLGSKLIGKLHTRQIGEQMRGEMAPTKAYWEHQVQAQQAQKSRVESFLAADLWQTLQNDPNRVPPGSNVKESGDAVVIGGVRVVRRRPELEVPVSQGPTGFDTAAPGPFAT